MKRNKYGVGIDPASIEKRTVDGIVFSSQHEAQQYISFKALEKAGAIAKLELQKPYQIHAIEGLHRILAPGEALMLKPICKYIADFVVTEKDGTVRVYDAKGFRTPLYRLKRKFVEAEYGILIVEI